MDLKVVRLSRERGTSFRSQLTPRLLPHALAAAQTRALTLTLTLSLSLTRSALRRAGGRAGGGQPGARARHRGGAHHRCDLHHFDLLPYDLPPTTRCSLCYPLPLVLPLTPKASPLLHAVSAGRPVQTSDARVDELLARVEVTLPS